MQFIHVLQYIIFTNAVAKWHDITDMITFNRKPDSVTYVCTLPSDAAVGWWFFHFSSWWETLMLELEQDLQSQRSAWLDYHSQ